MAGTVSLADLVERGGVYFNIAGSTPAECLAQALRTFQTPRGLDREALLKAVLEREALMPTGIGQGMAIPHPRSPLIAEESLQRVPVFFLQGPVAWEALDRKPVTTLFLILSAGARSHLAVLAAISHLAQRADFQALLATRPATGELVAFIRAAEASWEA
jgi:PTS system nitrogen regulatory IIA component